MIINISAYAWDPKGLVRASVHDYIRFNRYVAAQSTCTNVDNKAIIGKIHDLEKLLAIYDRYEKYETAFGKEWGRTFEYRNCLTQEIIETERLLSFAEMNIGVRECFVLAIERHPIDIRQSEEDEAKYGHPLVDKAKQRLSLLNKSPLNQPIRMYDVIMPVEVEEEEMDLIIESVSFVFTPYDMFQWKSTITQLHEYSEAWLSSSSWDGNDLALLEVTLEEYILIRASSQKPIPSTNNC
jgi:hypothetical protein